MILASALRRELAFHGLRAAQGATVFALAESVVSVQGTSSREFQDCASGDALEIIRLLREVGHVELPVGESELTSDFKASRTSLVVGDEALSVPAVLTPAERAAGVHAFARGVAHPIVGSAIARWSAGEAEIVANRPTAALESALATPPPPDRAAIAVGSLGPIWLVDEPSRRWGRFKPCVALVVTPPTDDRRFWTAVGRVATNPFGAPPDRPMISGAVAATWDRAEVAASAEATERWAASHIDPEQLRVATWDEIAPEAIHPDSVISYLPWQHGRVTGLTPYQPDQPRVWVRCATPSGVVRYVLADLVFYGLSARPTLLHHSATSSGMAAHADQASATAAAWQELVERDAFLRWWYSKRPAPAVVPTGLSELGRAVEAHLRRGGWTIGWYSIGRAGRPVVLAVARRDNAVALGCSCAPVDVAIEKSLREAWSVAQLAGETPVRIDQVRSPRDHGVLYLHDASGGDFDALLNDADPVDLPVQAIESPPESCVIYTWSRAVTTPYVVVRVIDPDLIPITFGYGRDPLGRADVGALVEASDGRLDRPLLPHPFA